MSKRLHDGIDILKSDILEREVLYGERFRFPMWFKNRSTEALHVRAVSISLQADAGWVGPRTRMAFRAEIGLELPPGCMEIRHVTIVPPLDCLAYSNFLDVIVEYGSSTDLANGRPRLMEKRNLDWLLVKEVPAPVSGAEVFVSFKDPENEDLAQLAAKYLRRAGFLPYLAREDGRCGSDYWEEKITPAIRRSAGILVIWSPEAVRHPESVQREIAIARSSAVSVGLFLSADADPPAEYPASILEYVRFDSSAPYAGFANGIAAAAKRWKVDRKCF